MENEENKKEEVKAKEEVKEVETKKEEVKEVETKKEDKKIEIPSKFKTLVKEIEEMSVLDLAELVKILEDKFGVSAAPQVIAGAPAAGGAAAADGAGEKSSFSVVLTEVGDKKIQVIKTIRDITKKGLKDSKDLADAIASGPQVIKENAKKDEAEEIKKLFEEAGAKVELK